MPTQNTINNTIVDNDFSVQVGDIQVFDGNVNIGSATPGIQRNISIEQTSTLPVGISIQNLDATSLSAAAVTEHRVDPAGGRAYSAYIAGPTTYSVGLDTTTNNFAIRGGISLTGDRIFTADNFGNVIVASTSGSTNVTVQIGTNGDYILEDFGGTLVNTRSSGESSYPLQPAFLANVGAPQTNVTGAGATYTVQFPNEVYDQNNNFNGTSTFNAPVTGKYYLQVFLFLQGVTSSHTSAFVRIDTSNRNYIVAFCDAGSLVDNFGQVTLMGSCVADMDASDTAIFRVRVANGAAVINIANGGATDLRSYACGYLVA